MKRTLYLETTIPSYLVARPSRDIIVAAHQELTRRWWDERLDDFKIYISQLVLDEVGDGDLVMARNRIEKVRHFTTLDIDPVVSSLAGKLILLGGMPLKAKADAVHVAVAAINEIEYLLTWNCAHINNAEMKTKIAEICADHGFQLPIICTPEELLG